jgi:hypothetical protein
MKFKVVGVSEGVQSVVVRFHAVIEEGSTLHRGSIDLHVEPGEAVKYQLESVHEVSVVPAVQVQADSPA